MHSEMDWLTKTDGGESVAEAYRFFMRPDPDMRDFVGPIETRYDELTGREMRYRAAKVSMLRGAEATQEVEVFLDPLPHIRLPKAKPLQGWYQPAFPESPKSRPRPCYTDAELTEPYGGMCPVGCSFCYINSGFRGYRGTGLMTVPINYGDQVRAMLKKQRTGAAGYFSSFSDPFLALESYYHNTQRAAEAFDEVGLPVFFLSRLQYPGWALDLLTKNKYSYAQKSINTPDPEDWKKLSPGALPLMDHLDEIREMRRRGIYVSIQVNPVVPGIVTHEDVERLFEMLAEAGANHVIVKFVEAGFSWAQAMGDRIVQRFGDNRAAGFRELFTQNIGGQRTVAEEYRMEGHRRYRAKATQLGLTYAVCYEYRAVPGTAGVSVGREFMTSDQCHGQRVPMFTRLTTDVPFSEVEACPPSGCLTCAADNEGAPRCGNELMGEAKALRAPDFRNPVL
jgi:DNA repair photolyase